MPDTSLDSRPVTRLVGRFLVPAALAAVFAAPLWFMIVGSLRPTTLPPPRTLELVPPPEGFRTAFGLRLPAAGTDSHGARNCEVRNEMRGSEPGDTVGGLGNE